MFESCRAHEGVERLWRAGFRGNPLFPVCPLVRVHKGSGAGEAGASWGRALGLSSLPSTTEWRVSSSACVSSRGEHGSASTTS
jgi:hypothetical protein